MSGSKWKSEREPIWILSYIIVFFTVIELVSVRIIGYPLATSPPLSRALFYIGTFAQWIGGGGVVIAYTWVLLQFQKEQRNIPIIFTLLVWMLLPAAFLSLILPEFNPIKIFLYACSFFTLLFLFNLGRRQIDRQSHIICYLFAAPLIFRFLYLLLESLQTVGLFFLPPEIYSYLRYVDEILMLIALVGIGMVVFDKITFPWNYKKSFVVTCVSTVVIGYIFLLLKWPWTTLAVTQEIGWGIFSSKPYLAIIFYAIPMFLGVSSILLLCVEGKTFMLGCGLLFVVLGQSNISHTSLFYQFLSLLGLFYLLYDGAKRPKYILRR